MPRAGMAAEASPPRLGCGGLAEVNRCALRREPTEAAPKREASVRRCQARVLMGGHGLSLESEVIGEGGLWGKPRPWPVRGHRVNGPYPQHPSLGELLDAVRSRGWEITRE